MFAIKKGLVHIYTGDGKGKTTSAVGLAVRAFGRGMRIIFAQFLKDGVSGEIKILNELGNGFRVCKSGLRENSPGKWMNPNCAKPGRSKTASLMP